MNYETRKRMVSNWLFDFLKNYEVPPHLDQDASKKELVNMVEDINSELPLLKENSFKLLLENVAKHIRKNQTSRRWPTIAFFIKAVKEHREKAMNDMAKETLPSPSHNEKIDRTLIINAKRIKDGIPVDEYYIVGNGKKKLLEEKLITEQDLKKYDGFKRLFFDESQRFKAVQKQ